AAQHHGELRPVGQQHQPVYRVLAGTQVAAATSRATQWPWRSLCTTRVSFTSRQYPRRSPAGK
ncbi:hypothetical protein ABZ260_37985, partial [Streptosporangium sp. NPDC006013]|uniref:hypothetical protein n=1 Tax=Streptosporangium sp. NPDC006013 TaxID=3155596 RepID=UPI0033A05C6D